MFMSRRKAFAGLTGGIGSAMLLALLPASARTHENLEGSTALAAQDASETEWQVYLDQAPFEEHVDLTGRVNDQIEALESLNYRVRDVQIDLQTVGAETFWVVRVKAAR
jgi:hypothetical protein